MRRTWPGILMLACACFAGASGSWAAPPVPPPEQAEPSPSDQKAEDTATASPLSNRQERLAQRFAELEKLLLRMAELTAPTDPRRAALLQQAVAQSKKQDIDHQFGELVKLLEQQRLSLAIKGQQGVQRDLGRLLDLLLSEDRTKRIQSEKERIRAYLKRVNKIIKEQKSVKGRTQRDGDTPALADRQRELGDKTGELAEDLKQDAAKSQPEEKPGDDDQNKPGKKSDDKDAESDDSKPGDSKSGDSKSEKSDEGKQSDKGEQGKQGQSPDQGKPQESQGKQGQPQNQSPMPGQPNQGQPSGDQQQQQQSDNPAQQRLEQAQRRMREAQQKLEQAKREDAVEKQAEAIKELERAKADLEEILRQLREEEMARMLAMLESRFRKMLDAQVEVYEGTKRVDKVPQAQRDRDDEIEAGRLSRKESQIVVEADKCLTVLREEGSAVAFPEAVVEMREDMQQVVERLAGANVGEFTQAIETDIITALEEMIAALKKAQKEMEQKKQRPNAQVVNGEPSLVDTLAELKMIRALQMRVNRRTQQYVELTKKDEGELPELLEALRRLAEREARIHQVTRDIVVGRNR